MSQAKWIWYPGEFEIYHNLLLSCRRQEFGCDYPCMWYLPANEKSVRFFKKVNLKNPVTVHVHTHSKGYACIPGKRFPVNADFTAPAGDYTLSVELYDIEAFPSLFVDADGIETDESWTTDLHEADFKHAACEPAYYLRTDDPKVFPFAYSDLEIKSAEETDGGVLYDFGKECFGPVTLGKIEDGDEIKLTYGESRNEALDFEKALVRETLTDRDELTRPARAFRYIHVKSANGNAPEISAKLEYLPVEEKASFECDDEKIRKIWDTCAYTFHLNSREFFLDGIKRDRWVWSGDAYQSYMINRCLYGDNGLTERTIRALLGKMPVRMHVNRINDYSAYLIIAIWEHYFATGRKEFIESVWQNVKALYEFIISRLNEDGYVVKVNDDWIFIDWGVLDKEGPVCAEQILLWQVYNSMEKLAAVMGESGDYAQRAAALKEKIMRDYWDEEKGAFTDSFVSGKRFVTRQTNVLAVLFDFADEEKTASIEKNALLNPDLPQITTPYFKLYELMALCKTGHIETAQDYIDSYWGGMLDEGATSVWEFYDPKESGAQHYAMYGSDYGKSLCHAWGSGPILLLIKYIAGINVTSAGGKTYEVKPNAGRYRYFRATAPVGDKLVTVEYKDGNYTVAEKLKESKPE